MKFTTKFLEANVMHMARLILLTAVFVVFGFGTASAQTTAFNYQGSLNTSGSPATGNYDFEFALFDSLQAGTQLGSTLTRSTVAVANGVFTVSLDFGSQFPGANRFLEIRLRLTGGGLFTTLTPRSPVNSSPYSVKSLTADSAVNATTAATATNALSLGGVIANQYLQTNGSGSGLTNLDASSISTGTLSNARLGQIATANIADAAVTSTQIAGDQVVKGVTVGTTTLTDNVTLVGSGNITVTPTGNTLTIAADGVAGGISGGAPGVTNTIPIWTGETTIGNSLITQSGSDILMPNRVILAAGEQDQNITFGSPNGDTGMTISGGVGLRGDVRFNRIAGFSLVVGQGSGPPPYEHGIAIARDGVVTIGLGRNTPNRGKLHVEGGVGISGFAGVYGKGDLRAGVYGESTSGDGVYGQGLKSGVHGESTSGDGVFGQSRGTGSGVSGVNFSINGRGVEGHADPSRGGFGVYAANGYLATRQLAPGGTQTLCWKISGEISTCGSSLRYKTNIGQFGQGLKLVNKLHPITFDWKDGGTHDLGLAAEDVAAIEPLLVTYNEKGQVEGVKYDRISVVLINAVKEQQSQIERQRSAISSQQSVMSGQQSQIERQQTQIDELKLIVCEVKPRSKGCLPR